MCDSQDGGYSYKTYKITDVQGRDSEQKKVSNNPVPTKTWIQMRTRTLATSTRRMVPISGDCGIEKSHLCK